MPAPTEDKTDMEKDFSGKVVAITGGARGIGEALTRAFLSRGARVAALDRRWDEQSPLYRDILEGGGLALACDITVDREIDAALVAVLDRFGTVDVLINNAAMRQRDFYPMTGASTVLDTQDEHWEQMFRVNVVGALKVIRRFIRPMLEQGSGSVINVSANGSLTHACGEGLASGNHPHLLNQPYDATKAAFTNMSFYLADEVRHANVAVNVIFPGSTRTTGSDAMVEGREKLGLAAPLLEPDHVVPVSLMLAAQTAEGVTGRAFDVVPWNLVQTR